MTMGLTIAVILGVAIAFVLVPVFLNSYRRLAGPRVVICPETQETAVVRCDRTQGALGAAMGRSEVRLEQCSRWPLRAGCPQQCLRGVTRPMAESRGLLLPAQP